MIITVDGPAGAGKSSVCRTLAEKLQFVLIDTGAMFRAVALAAKRAGCDWQDQVAISKILLQINLSFQQVKGQSRILLNAEDVEDLIREPEISKGASAVASLPDVRSFLLKQQRQMGSQGQVLLEGRDTGTVVFPNADLKFYLFASAEKRAHRRMLQQGHNDPEILSQIKKAIEDRDRADSERKIAPLRCPEDAIRIDSSELPFEVVVEKMLSEIRQRQPSPS